MEVSTDILRDIWGAQAREMRILIIELCGVFWIAAELVILFFVIEARRHVGRNPIPASPLWDRAATRRAELFFLLLVVVLATVVLRPIIWVSLSWRLQCGPLDAYASAMHDFNAVLRHLAVWAAFVTLWVVLEAAIVYQGYRAYRLFRGRVLDKTGGSTGTRGVDRFMFALMLLGVLAAMGMLTIPAFTGPPVDGPIAKAGDSWEQVLRISEAWLFPYRNALYLYLRLAGVVWIGVEWIAALVLWRTWVLVDRVLRTRRGLS